jgi:single-stranded-DNA-specific exonuclease
MAAAAPGAITAAAPGAITAPAPGAPAPLITGATLESLLRGSGPQPRSGALAGRLLRVLAELELIELGTAPLAIRLPAAPARTELERSAAFRAYRQRLDTGLEHLDAPRRAAEPAAAAAA